MLEARGDIAGIRRRTGAKQLSETTMSYSEFTSILQVKQAFGLTAVECVRFLPSTDAIALRFPLMRHHAEEIISQ
jgi:hypothetical protein